MDRVRRRRVRTDGFGRSRSPTAGREVTLVLGHLVGANRVLLRVLLAYRTGSINGFSRSWREVIRGEHAHYKTPATNYVVTLAIGVNDKSRGAFVVVFVRVA